MALNHDQKRYIKKHARESTLTQIANDLNLTEKEVGAYLKDQWKPDKYEKFLQRKLQKKEQLIINTSAIRFRDLVRNNWMNIGFLILLIAVVYANSLLGQFVSDDIAVIRDGNSLGTISYIWSDPFVFMRQFFMFLIYSLFGKNPLPYHLLSIMFHMGTTTLLFLIIAVSLNSSIAFLTASLFAVHPLLSEPISWISGGPYPQYSFFILSSLLSLILFIRSNDRKKYYVSIFLSLLALGSADKAMVLPLLFSLYLYVFTDFKKTWKLLIPYFGLTFVWGAHYVLRLPGRIASVQHEQFREEITFNPFMQIPVAISSYIELLIWPDKLSIYHSDFVMSTLAFILRIGVFILYLAGLLYSFFKKKIIFFGMAFFLLALSPTLSPLGISSLLAERYAYIGSAGLFFTIAYGFWTITKNKKYETLTYLVFMLLIGMLSLRTIMRNFDWSNEDTLWIATGKTAIYDPVSHMNLGDMHRRHRNFTEAEKEFKIALELSPNNAYAFYNLGLVYTEAGANQPALDMYQKALSIEPNLWQAYQNMSVVYSNMGDDKKSLEQIKKAAVLSPNNPSLLTNMGLIYLRLGQKSEAQKVLSESLRINPTDQKARSAFNQAMQ